MTDNFSAKPQGSLRELLKTLIAVVFNRLHLAGIEYKEYTTGQLLGVVWLVLALFALQIAILALLFLVAWIIPPHLRIVIFSIIVLTFLGIFIGALLTFKKHLSQLASSLGATLNEIREDWSTFVNRREL
jgi:uncharacterized membrane protein YqjE